MGTIKIEFNLPEFEKELQVNVVIRRDGEVVLTSSATHLPRWQLREKRKQVTLWT